MTKNELQQWLEEYQLEDQWWLYSDGVTDPSLWTIAELEAHFGDLATSGIYIMHSSSTNEEWIEVEQAKPIAKGKVKVIPAAKGNAPIKRVATQGEKIPIKKSKSLLIGIALVLIVGGWFLLTGKNEEVPEERGIEPSSTSTQVVAKAKSQDPKPEKPSTGKDLEFSWDRVPVSAHFGIADGLEPEQYDFVADHFDFITLTAGRLPRDSTGNAETFTAEAALAIKKRNPKAKVVFYWASDKPKSQSKIANAAYPGEYLIHTRNRAGGRKEVTKHFDVTRKEVQDWWSDAAADAVHKYSCDGIYVDGATAGRVGGPWSSSFGEEKAVDMDKAMFAMLEDARRKMGPDKLILFNPLHGYDDTKTQLGQEYLTVTDGAMIDDFDRIRVQSPEYMANTIKTMQENARDGKIMIFKGWPRFLGGWRTGKFKKTSHEDVLSMSGKEIIFPLACFLIGAEPNCYFCYTWGWNPEEGSFDWYPEFDKPLGPPKGDAVQKGWTFQREFEHASVFVDLEKRTAKIDWREPPGE